MPSTRRRFLTRIGQAAAVGLAGCSARPPSTEPTDSPRSPTDSTASPTPSAPRLVTRSFESLETECGQQVHQAQVRFEAADSGGRVTLTGTIAGPNTCHIAALKRVTLADGTLDVTVETVNEYADDPDTTPVCGQCIVEIDYEGAFEFEGSLPGRVRVFHEAMSAPEDPVTVAERT